MPGTDGRWVTYAESSDGNPVSGGQVFVQPFPPTGTRYVISRGLHPLWSPDGKELWYHRLPDTQDHMEVVRVTSVPSQGTFAFGDPVPLPLRDMQYSQPTAERNWDMMPDGKRLLGLSSGDSARGQINVILNWSAELRQRVPSP
jgi:Tol biopolymer transport system component